MPLTSPEPPGDKRLPTLDYIVLKSKVLVPRRVQDWSEFDFDTSEEWQDFLWAHVRRGGSEYLWLEISDAVSDWQLRGGLAGSPPAPCRHSLGLRRPWGLRGRLLRGWLRLLGGRLGVA